MKTTCTLILLTTLLVNSCGVEKIDPTSNSTIPGTYVTSADAYVPLVHQMIVDLLGPDYEFSSGEERARLDVDVARASRKWANALEFEVALYPDGRLEWRRRSAISYFYMTNDVESILEVELPAVRETLVGKWQKSGEELQLVFFVMNGTRFRTPEEHSARLSSEGHIEMNVGWRPTTWDVEPLLRKEVDLSASSPQLGSTRSGWVEDGVSGN